MKRALAVLWASLLLAIAAYGQVPPAPTERVTDASGFLSPPARQALNVRLKVYEGATGHQVWVWVGKSTGATPLEGWTVRAFQSWRVGRKSLDDGLVLFLFSEDRKARIEVGYGLEGQMPDALASRILRDSVLPRLKAGDPDGAVTAGVDSILATMGGEKPTPKADAPESKPMSWLQIALLVVVGIGFLFLAIRNPGLAMYLLMLFARGGGGGGGNSGGGGGRSGGGGASGRW